MNLKILLGVALVIFAIAVWVFYKQGVDTPTIDIQPAQIDYEATEIKAVQTNDAGQTEYELTAQALTHNPTTNQDVMQDIAMQWQPNPQTQYKIRAGSAIFEQQTGELTLDNGFELTSNESNQGDKSQKESLDKNLTEDIKAIGKIVIKGDSLHANTKTKIISSDAPIMVTQQNNAFKAQRMQANLQQGDYEFTDIEMSFTPPKRIDKPLF